MLRAQRNPHAGWLVSGVLVAAFLPVVVAGPLLAPLVDRLSHPTLIPVVSLGQAVSAAALVCRVTPIVMLLLIALLSVGTAVVTPTLLAVIPDLYGESAAARGCGQLEAARNVGLVAGPALAGLLYSTGGGAAALVIDALTFVVIALTSFFVPVDVVGQALVTPGWWRSMREGSSVVLLNPEIRSGVLALFGAVLFSTLANTSLNLLRHRRATRLCEQLRLAHHCAGGRLGHRRLPAVPADAACRPHPVALPGDSCPGRQPARLGRRSTRHRGGRCLHRRRRLRHSSEPRPARPGQGERPQARSWPSFCRRRLSIDQRQHRRHRRRRSSCHPARGRSHSPSVWGWHRPGGSCCGPSALRS